MRIRPTELGCKGLLLFAALAVAFFATAYSNLFFLLLLFCVALGALAAVWTAGNLRGLQLVRLELPLAAAGDERAVACTLRAQRARTDLRLELLLERARLPLGHAASVAGTAVVPGVLPAVARGVQRVRGVRVSTRHPLGLFVARIDLPFAGELVTHPAPRWATASRRGGGAGDGDAAALHGHRSATAIELRPFRTGDALADVHWRATARRGAPVVKERERESAGARTVVLDRRCSDAELERGLAGATAAVLAADDSGATFGIGSPVYRQLDTIAQSITFGR